MQSSHPRSVHHVARRAIARCMQASKPSLLSFPRPANTRSSQRSHRSFLAAHALPLMLAGTAQLVHAGTALFLFPLFRARVHEWVCHARTSEDKKAGASRSGARRLRRAAATFSYEWGVCEPRPQTRSRRAIHAAPQRRRPSLHQHTVYRAMLYRWGEGKR